MKNKFAFTTILSTAGFLTLPALAQQQPNVIIIYMDDMGYQDLSCYGQEKWQTPQIDRLAHEGIQFTDAYSASPVSSPSRAALLTGRYPSRMGIKDVFFPESYTGIPENEVLISELLKGKGYATGIIGKWHLGHRDKYLPLQRGFDEYFGIPYSNDMTSQVYLRGNEVEEFHIDQSQMVKRYTFESVDFINRHKEQPFFLYLAHNMMHVPVFCSEEFKGKSGHGLYGDTALEVDWSIGEIVRCLEENKILENTLIVFSSDNGPWLQEGPLGGEAMPWREGKGTSFEGGVRIPFLVYWKGKIQPAIREDIVTTMDWFPTIVELCELDMPSDLLLDGYSLTDILLHGGKRKCNSYAYFRDNTIATGLRVDDWKIVLPEEQIRGNFWRASTAAHDTLLFNLKEDPGELVNLFYKYPEKAKEMTQALADYQHAFGEIPPKLVVGFNDQLRELRQQREQVIEEAKEKGVVSKAQQIDGFIDVK